MVEVAFLSVLRGRLVTHGRAQHLSGIAIALFLAGTILAVRPADRPHVLGRKHDPAFSQVRPKGRSRPDLLAREAALPAPSTVRDCGRIIPRSRRREAEDPRRPVALSGFGHPSGPLAGSSPARLPSRLRC